jgi:hypothetical protein
MSQPTRDANGRFVTGHNQPGPGRKPRAVEQAYLTTMESVCDEEAWQKIVERATLDAIAGDGKARLWLSGYLLGQPIQRTQEVKNKMGSLLDRLENISSDAISADMFDDMGDED